MKKSILAIVALGAALLISSLALSNPTPPSTVKAEAKDGDLTVPSNYQTWPKYLSYIQRPDANPKQIREIYINDIGYASTEGKPFPEGTRFVMENYSVVQNADGTPAVDQHGKLQKDKLLKVFLMAKVPNGAKGAPENMATGDWIYSAYLSDGTIAPDPTMGCRGCHLTQKDKDFVYRYDEYFQSKKAGLK
jgi:hypothetical protein